MSWEEVLAKLVAKFPKAEKLSGAAEVKGYLTVKLAAGDLAPAVRFLKDSLGFDYLDMLTAVDWKGPVNPDGYIRDPNPNVFLPEGATPQVEQAEPTPGAAHGDRIEAVYCLSKLDARLKIFLKADLPRSAPTIASLSGLYPAADWQEREAYDLLGVVYEGHPDLRKILTPDFIAGHPLRKDYVHQKDRFD